MVKYPNYPERIIEILRSQYGINNTNIDEDLQSLPQKIVFEKMCREANISADKVRKILTDVYGFNLDAVPDLSVFQKVNILYVLTGKSQPDLASFFGITVSSFISKLKKSKLSFEDLQKIADFFGVEFVAYVKFADKIITGETITELLKNSISHAGLSLNDMAEILRVTRQQISGSIKRGKYSPQELNDLVNIIGGKYECFFLMGTAKI